MKKILVGLALFFFVSAFAFADETLADAAKKEKERRAKIGKPARVITNKDIEDFKASGKVPSGTISSTNDSGEATTTDTQAAESQEVKGQTEDQWRQQYSDAARKVEDAQKQFDDLQARAASNVYTSNGVDMLTGVAGQNADNLAAAKQALEDAKAAQEDIQTRARRESVPPSVVPPPE